MELFEGSPLVAVVEVSRKETQKFTVGGGPGVVDVQFPTQLDEEVVDEARQRGYHNLGRRKGFSKALLEGGVPSYHPRRSVERLFFGVVAEYEDFPQDQVTGRNELAQADGDVDVRREREAWKRVNLAQVDCSVGSPNRAAFRFRHRTR